MKYTSKLSIILAVYLFSQFSNQHTALANVMPTFYHDSMHTTRLITNNENMPVAKISVPGKNMFKIADNEMNRNMKADLLSIQQLKSIEINVTTADLELTEEFLQVNTYSFSMKPYRADEIMGLYFSAENISYQNQYSIKEADFQINTSFHSSK